MSDERIIYSAADKTWAAILGIGLVAEVVFIVLGMELLSNSYWKWSRRQTFIPFASGVLLGHLCWQQAKYVQKLRDERDELLES